MALFDRGGRRGRRCLRGQRTGGRCSSAGGGARGVDMLNPAGVEAHRDQPLRGAGDDNAGATAGNPMRQRADRVDGDDPITEQPVLQYLCDRSGGRLAFEPSKITVAEGSTKRTEDPSFAASDPAALGGSRRVGRQPGGASGSRGRDARQHAQGRSARTRLPRPRTDESRGDEAGCRQERGLTTCVITTRASCCGRRVGRGDSRLLGARGRLPGAQHLRAPHAGLGRPDADRHQRGVGHVGRRVPRMCPETPPSARQSASSTTTGAWSLAPLPFRSSRSIRAPDTRRCSAGEQRAKSIRMPSRRGKRSCV